MKILFKKKNEFWLFWCAGEVVNYGSWRKHRHAKKMKIFEFLKRKKTYPDFDLNFCVERNLLTKEEKLRIEKDRAVAKWEKEVLGLKKKERKEKK